MRCMLPARIRFRIETKCFDFKTDLQPVGTTDYNNIISTTRDDGSVKAAAQVVPEFHQQVSCEDLHQTSQFRLPCETDTRGSSCTY